MYKMKNNDHKEEVPSAEDMTKSLTERAMAAKDQIEMIVYSVSTEAGLVAYDKVSRQMRALGFDDGNLLHGVAIDALARAGASIMFSMVGQGVAQAQINSNTKISNEDQAEFYRQHAQNFVDLVENRINQIAHEIKKQGVDGLIRGSTTHEPDADLEETKKIVKANMEAVLAGVGDGPVN